ncbi:MAG: hypothetical protein AVDCRST_MAG56-664 [uncultured Cytophagales bacterium]|uniref:Uncharacterized protein n=1 Tax=uncultured Cytophagales bacterium TaxID=158755 RepID=A0A6J4HC28_9SPHI|nr:MAG: hypothetical protein AVDCRST_MAG56-664 [uncultured Cytophagales bacterium]
MQVPSRLGVVSDYALFYAQNFVLPSLPILSFMLMLLPILS